MKDTGRSHLTLSVINDDSELILGKLKLGLNFLHRPFHK